MEVMALPPGHRVHGVRQGAKEVASVCEAESPGAIPASTDQLGHLGQGL